MKGLTYKTPEGLLHEVLDFDEVNKMAYINVYAKNYRWVHESEYSKWVVNDTAVMPKIYVPDIPAQIKTEDDAIQIENTSGLFQHPQEGIGEEGSERGRMEQGIEGDEVAEKSQVKSEEKVKKTRVKKEK